MTTAVMELANVAIKTLTKLNFVENQSHCCMTCSSDSDLSTKSWYNIAVCVSVSVFPVASSSCYTIPTHSLNGSVMILQ